MPQHDYILVVEDDADLVELLLLVLSGEGYPVRAARNGSEAMSLVEQDMPALIVLDLLMPVMDGWEFARQFHALHGDGAPIIVTTAAEHARQRAADIGAAAVFSKPFAIESLLQTVAELLPSTDHVRATE